MFSFSSSIKWPIKWPLNCPSLLPAARRGVALAVLAVCVCLTGCRRDMQDQPRYEMYRTSEFFDDRSAARPLPAHTVARGYLREDAQFFTGRTREAARPGNRNTTMTQGTGTQNTGPNTGLPAAGTAPPNPPASSSSSAPAPAAAAANFEAGLLTTLPLPVTAELLDRGQNEYQTFCLACHGPTGEGDGMIVRRGYRKPTSYHDERLRGAPVGHFFDVMTNGWGAMPSYSAMVPPQDRWAIAAYIRTLQLSRAAKLSELPSAEQQRLAGLVPAQPAPTASPTPAPMPAQQPAGRSRP